MKVAKFWKTRDHGDVYEVIERNEQIGLDRIVGYAVASSEAEAIQIVEELGK